MALNREQAHVEARRETIFKDAVLSAAETQRMEIIGDAQRQSNETLQAARAACGQADEKLLLAAMDQAAEKEHSAAVQAARRQLLQHRAQLVDGLFEEVEERLAAFAKSKKYPGWLAARLKARAPALEKGAQPVICLRKEDEKHGAALKKALPKARLQQDAGIRLGGLKVSDGKRLYDETLDAALAEEMERFYKESKLTL